MYYFLIIILLLCSVSAINANEDSTSKDMGVFDFFIQDIYTFDINLDDSIFSLVDFSFLDNISSLLNHEIVVSI